MEARHSFYRSAPSVTKSAPDANHRGNIIRMEDERNATTVFPACGVYEG